MCAIASTFWRRARRQCARRWHAVLPIWCCLFVCSRRRHDNAAEEHDNNKNDGLKNRQNSGNLFLLWWCFLSALLAIPPFTALLFVTGLSDHFFAVPFEQFHWSLDDDVNVAEEVIRELVGQPSKIPNLVPLNPWNRLPSPLIEPDCGQNWLTRKRSILIIVKSGPNRPEYRDAIRATYGAVKRMPPEASAAADGGGSFRVRTVFVLGWPAEDAEQQMERLKAEANKHKDMLVGDFADTYFNNTLKFVNSIRFARHHCGSPNAIPYVLLLDDDYMLFPWNLVAEVQKHVPNERLYMGWRMDTTPFRFRPIKWAVSLADYPFSAYPPYITAGAVLLTGQTVAEFHAAIPHTHTYRLDDIYTGILAYLLAIQPQHHAGFAFHRPPSAAHSLASTIAVHGYAPTEMRDAYAEEAREKH